MAKLRSKAVKSHFFVVKSLILTCVVALMACGQPTSDLSQTSDDLVKAKREPIATFAPKVKCKATEILMQLNCIEGVSAKEIKDGSVPAGYRRFDLAFAQPTDHNEPDQETFNQKIVLLHKNSNAPMILHSSGYNIFSVNLNNISRAFSANQVQVEHRYFAQSIPVSKDWSKLDIRQSAADYHRITVALRRIYSGNWLNTGASKGGMTSIYHHRFYPQDLDGTVALVAPLSFSTADERYVSFVDAVGGDKYKNCRAEMETLQGELLRRRDRLSPNMTGSYEILGSADVAFEHTILETTFIFWQYKNPDDASVGCKALPSLKSSDEDLYSWLTKVNNPEDYNDESILGFQPYYYQAARELGSPASKLSHLTLRYPDSYKIETYIPKEAPQGYDPEAMKDIADWVSSSSNRIIYVYGEFDSWTAGAFKPRANVDSHLYTVPAGNHGANVFLLPQEERQQAMAIMGGWLGVKAKVPVVNPKWLNEGLEMQEMRHFRGL